MKKIITLLVLIVLSANVNAQDFKKAGNYVTIGYGLDPWGHPVLGGLGYKKSSLGPVLAFYERGITDLVGIGRIGAGGGVGYSFYNQDYSDVWGESKYSRTRLSIILRGAYHVDFNIPSLDLYAGVGAAIHLYTDRDKVSNVFVVDSETKSSGIYAGHYVFAGVRYYFTDGFGVYAEAGHGLAALNGGLVFKF